MSGGYKAPDGSLISEEAIGRWNEAYEQGEFPEGEHTVGAAVIGKPQPQLATVTFKAPVGMKRALEEKAREDGVSVSEYVRAAVAERLLAAG